MYALSVARPFPSIKLLVGLQEFVVLALLAKSCIGIFQKLLLLGSNLIGMNLIFDTYLLYGLAFFKSLKNYFGFEAGYKISSFLFHSQQINNLLFCCPNFLDHYRLLCCRTCPICKKQELFEICTSRPEVLVAFKNLTKFSLRIPIWHLL